MLRINMVNGVALLSAKLVGMMIGIAIGALPCAAEDKADHTEKKAQKQPEKKPDGDKDDADDPQPCLTGPSTEKKPIDAKDIPRFGANSPFESGKDTPDAKPPRRMWAKSFRWAKAPDFVVEKWLTDKPETEGKYVLIEYWATWCPPCRRSIPLLNGFHEKFGDELVVIGISHESEADVRKLEKPKIEFYSAVDTKARMKKELGVWGIPHVILLEPEGHVIWEGFPLQKHYELTDEIIEKILAVGRKLKAKKASAAGQ